MLTGKLPFTKADSLSQFLAQIASQDPPSPRGQSCDCEGPRDHLPEGDGETSRRPVRHGRRLCGRAAAMAQPRAAHHPPADPLGAPPPLVAPRNRVAARVAVVSVALLTVVSVLFGGLLWNQANRAREARFRQAIESRYRAETQVRALILQAEQRLRIPRKVGASRPRSSCARPQPPCGIFPRGRRSNGFYESSARLTRRRWLFRISCPRARIPSACPTCSTSPGAWPCTPTASRWSSGPTWDRFAGFAARSRTSPRTSIPGAPTPAGLQPGWSISCLRTPEGRAGTLGRRPL